MISRPIRWFTRNIIEPDDRLSMSNHIRKLRIEATKEYHAFVKCLRNADPAGKIHAENHDRLSKEFFALCDEYERRFLGPDPVTADQQPLRVEEVRAR